MIEYEMVLMPMRFEDENWVFLVRIDATEEDYTVHLYMRKTEWKTNIEDGLQQEISSIVIELIQDSMSLNGAEDFSPEFIKGKIHEMNLKKEDEMLLVACQVAEELLLDVSIDSHHEMKSKVLNVLTGLLQV